MNTARKIQDSTTIFTTLPLHREEPKVISFPAKAQPEKLMSIEELISFGESRKADYTARGVKKATPAETFTSYAEIKQFTDWMLANKKYRLYAMFVTGCATGLRVSDLCQLKLSDLFSFSVENGKLVLAYRDNVNIEEQKTGKRTYSAVDELSVTEAVKTGVTRYLYTRGFVSASENSLVAPATLTQDLYLFVSRKGGGKAAMTPTNVYVEITKAAEAAGIGKHIATHSMRRTFLNIANTIAASSTLIGAHSTALADCQILARHSSADTTLRYMNATKSRILSLRRAVSDFLLGRTAIKEISLCYDWETE